MLQRFLRIRVSLIKALADTGSNINFDDVEVRSLGVVSDTLREVQETLTVLCNRSATLLTMDAALSCLLYSIDKTCPFGAALHSALVTRINKRRTIVSNAMQYLHNGGTNIIHPDLKRDTKSNIEKFLVKLWGRMHPADAEEPEVVDLESEESLVELSFQQKLQRAIKEQCAEPEMLNPRGGGGMADLKRELQRFRRTSVRGPKLEMMMMNLKTIQVTSVESERSFSIGGRFCTKLRSRLGDNILSSLTMLHFYFKANEVQAT